MASQTPYYRLTGTWLFWLAPAQEAKPNLDATPAGNWVALGETDGDQTLQYTGTLTAFTDNSHTGRVKHVRPEEGFSVQFSLAKLELESLAKINSMATSDITTTTSGALNVKQLPNKRGFVPTRYALLARGGAVSGSNVMSPYGSLPAQLWIPQGVFDGEPSMVFSKGGSPTPQVTFIAEEDDTQSAGNEFGYLEVQYT